MKHRVNWDTYGCSHNPMSQKARRITKKNSQNWINIYVLLFSAMAIMANYCFFIHMNVKKIKLKIYLMKFEV
jgi:membrane protein YdbS with pleckstrin-like domain